MSFELALCTDILLDEIADNPVHITEPAKKEDTSHSAVQIVMKVDFFLRFIFISPFPVLCVGLSV